MIITMENLRKSFNKQVIIDIDYLEITSGITGLIGDNGTGKTTLLNILAGIVKSDHGTVLYDHQVFTKAIYQHLTLVYQHPYMLNRSVYDNIAYPLTLRKKSKEYIKIRTNELMDSLNISHLESNNANSLSGGEKQKVALARALACDPKILLLDEPTSNIDQASKKIIENEILKFASKNLKIALVVSHDEKQISRICHRCIHLE